MLLGVDRVLLHPPAACWRGGGHDGPSNEQLRTLNALLFPNILSVTLCWGLGKGLAGRVKPHGLLQPGLVGEVDATAAVPQL